MRPFLTRRWVLRHLAMVGLVAAFLVLGWWQFGRARGGNLLSFGYAVEWPVFAVFVVFVWSREIRGELRAGSGAPEPSSAERSGVPADLRIEVPDRRAGQVAADLDDAGADSAEVRAYNEFLSWLGAHPEARPGDYHRAGS